MGAPAASPWQGRVAGIGQAAECQRRVEPAAGPVAVQAGAQHGGALLHAVRDRHHARPGPEDGLQGAEQTQLSTHGFEVPGLGRRQPLLRTTDEREVDLTTVGIVPGTLRHDVHRPDSGAAIAVRQTGQQGLEGANETRVERLVVAALEVAPFAPGPSLSVGQGTVLLHQHRRVKSGDVTGAAVQLIEVALGVGQESVAPGRLVAVLTVGARQFVVGPAQVGSRAQLSRVLLEMGRRAPGTACRPGLLGE